MKLASSFKQVFTILLTTAIIFFSITINAEKSHQKKHKKSHSIKKQLPKPNKEENQPQNNNLSSLFNKIETEHLNYELKRVETLFSHVDELFQNTNIEYQEVLNNDKLGPPGYSDLYTFLAGPHGLATIIPLVEKEIHHNIKELVNDKFRGRDSLLHLVKFLWRKKILSPKQAQHILAKNCPLSSSEIIKLVENGIVKSSKGSIVKLRTGSCYGDPLLLFNKLETILSTSLHEHPKGSLDDIIFPLDNLLIAEFNKHQIDAEKAVIDGKIIDQLRKHFLFISNLGLPIRFKSQTVNFSNNSPPSAAGVNTINSYSSTILPTSLTAMMVGNHYFATYNSSLYNSLSVNPMGLSLSGTFSWTSNSLSARGLDWWVYYTDSYLGIGGDYTFNIDKGTFWSNGQASFLTIGGMLAGWKNYLQVGISLQTLLANSVGAGANAIFTIERERSVAYVEKYPIDGKFASLRGLHKIEINDNKHINQTASVAFNFWSTEVPISVAFRAGVDHTKNSIFRTYVDLENAQSMLSEADIPGILLILGKKIKNSKIPNFEHPMDFKEGDELVQKKTGALSGAFVTGLEAIVPVAPARVGVNLEITGEFELGLMRLPNNKFQLSVEPTYIAEIGFFGTMMNILFAGTLYGISLARKQIFLFDFNNEKAKEAYFTMIETGELPNFYEIEVSTEERGPENLLMDFRTQNHYLRDQGIELTYLEQTRIGENRTHVGIYAPIVPGFLAILNKADKLARPRKDRFNISFEGIDRQTISAYGTSIATNGIIAVKRKIYGGKVSEGQGFSGRLNQELYVTHRRVYTLDDFPNETSKSRFDSLLVHAVIEDTKITGNEENHILHKINKLFSTGIEEFSSRNSKFPRVITLEREFSRKELHLLSTIENEIKKTQLINKAHRATGIGHDRLRILLEELKNKHPDRQGLIIKQFIETADGFKGFAALHQLLQAKPEDLLINVESGYMELVNEARTFIILNSKVDDSDNPQIGFSTSKSRKNKKDIHSFYDDARNLLRHIDWQLRRIEEDNYFLEPESPLAVKIGKLRYDSLIENGLRQDKSSVKTALSLVRSQIIALMDLKKQGFSNEDRKAIYKIAQKKRLRILENADWIYLKYNSSPCKGRSKIATMLGIIRDRIASLSIDETMNKIDAAYVENYTKALTEAHENLNTLLNLCSEPQPSPLAKKSDDEPETQRVYRSRSLMHSIHDFSLKAVAPRRKSKTHHEDWDIN